jgi:uncharacterized protein (TIGR02118 family)
MSAKLIALYTQPENEAEFDRHYFDIHLPLAEKMPGLARMEVAKFKTNLMGGNSPYYLIAELYFDSVADLNAAMSSPEGRAAAKDVMSFAAKNVTMLVAEVTSAVGAGVY